MKVVIASTSLLALPTYEALKKSQHEFLALVTKSEGRSGRGNKILENDLAVALSSEKIVRVSGQEDLFNALMELKPDVAIAISFGMLIKPTSLEIPQYGWLNLHFSLLPKYRGAAPLARAILAGERKSGVTVFRLDAGMDTGPIYTSKELACDLGSNGQLLEKFAIEGSSEVMRALEMISSGISPRPQTGIASFAPKIEGEELRLDFNSGAEQTINKIRAFSPKPGAWCEFKERRIKILQAHPTDYSNRKPGEVISISPLIISLASGVIEITLIQEAGKRVMTAQEWVRGSRVKIGDLFV